MLSYFPLNCRFTFYGAQVKFKTFWNPGLGSWWNSYSENILVRCFRIQLHQFFIHEKNKVFNLILGIILCVMNIDQRFFPINSKCSELLLIPIQRVPFRYFSSLKFVYMSTLVSFSERFVVLHNKTKYYVQFF